MTKSEFLQRIIITDYRHILYAKHDGVGEVFSFANDVEDVAKKYGYDKFFD